MNESSRSGAAERSPRLGRRSLFAGAATVGAVAAVATVMPRLETPEAVVEKPKASPERGGGYSLSEHVKHYYRTTQI